MSDSSVDMNDVTAETVSDSGVGSFSTFVPG